jgi:hypothetical protein
MNHPSPEEWVPYLYGESPAEARRALKAHLSSCAECRNQLAEWRSGLKRLDAWTLKRERAPALGRLLNPAALKWAFAALVLLLAGFAAGRFGGDRTSAAEMRASLEPELRRALLQDIAIIAREEANQAAASALRAAGQEAERLLAAYANSAQSQRIEDRRAVEANLARMEAQRVADLAELKRELDVLAVNTDAGLRHTVRGLAQLVNYRGTPAPINQSPTATQ